MPRVRVRPSGESTHHLSLSGLGRTFGLLFLQGPQSLIETPATPSNINIGSAGARFGDFDPSMTHIEQRDWSGGRGLQNFVDDGSRYFDGSAWTLTPDLLVSQLQWHLTSGVNPQAAELPGNVTWTALVGDDAYLARQFTPSTTFQSSGMFMWIRKVGNPGPLHFAVRTSGASPGGTTVVSASIVSSAVPDVLSVFKQGVFTNTTAALASGSEYYATAQGSTNDTYRDHWEVACGSSGAGGQASSDGTTWRGRDVYPYYLIDGADFTPKWHFFSLTSAAGTSAVLHAVSEHGSTATASSTVKMANSTITGTWSTVAWSSALTGSVHDVTVLDNIAYMAKGGGVGMFSARVNGASNEGQSLASTSVGDFVHNFYDPIDGPQLYRAVSSESRVYRASTVAFGSTFTWKPSTGVPVGEVGPNIMDILDYDNQIYVRKADDLFAVKNDKAQKVNVGLSAIPSSGNYSPMLVKELYLYIAWSYSLERLYGATLDDVGPWRGQGLPSSRAGIVSCLEAVIGWLFAGIDAGATGVSSVLAWDNRGWHEVFRAPVAGWRVQNLKLWSPPNQRPRLFISCGGKIFWVALPFKSLNPTLDKGGAIGDVDLSFQHESVLETGVFDMGTAELPKLYDSIYMRSRNVNSSGNEIYVDYQMDEEIGGSSWVSLTGAIRVSPADNLNIRQGDKRAMRLRYRMQTAASTTPVIVDGTVLKAVSRTPIKRRFTIRSRSGSLQVDQQGAKDADPSDFYVWYQNAAVTTVPLHLRAQWKEIDDMWVYAEPPVVRRTYRTPSGEWGAEYDITLREI